ncbi:hypothetical protein S7S_10005 [Isoalcanivorax pacificus W11-5]|uniref:DUF2062 domain-containing protein n=1 Tax=Isoalcanivorax pacificus W11-5 TaxID=391936 RepID=A0A0B4XPQ5_9GAMM|nr:DUF2062 domain-containing protein [Isoalcanivorax pacificus]AJD48413.1 hypothetical protein S7S_10005 [Isoalcanivorax pacificus W11-5]
MPKHLFRKHLPSADRIRQSKSLGLFGEILGDPGLWHLNRRSLSGAVFIGTVAALLPMPFQMLPATLLAIYFKCNLPLSLAIVWLTNPFTYVPVFYFTYRVGARLLDMPVTPPHPVSFAWLAEQMIPLWVGSLLCGVLFGLAGMVITRLLWRLAVVRSWKQRRQLRLKIRKQNVRK